MTLDDWPGRRRAESLRQWPILQALAGRVEELDAIDGLIILGSFTAGNPDELSDIDVWVVVARGGFQETWADRHRLADDSLVSWGSHPEPDFGFHKWLTRDVVKVECCIIDPSSGSRELADPCIVLVGDRSLIDRFPRITRAELAERNRKQRDEQKVPEDDSELTYGELIDWKLSELKRAVRRGLRANATPS